MTTAKITPATLRQMKFAGKKAAGLSLYTAWEAALADEIVDFIVVGDSAAMTLLGLGSTIPATMAQMLMFTTAVWRGAKRPLKIGDLPWGTFTTPERAVDTAVEFARYGAGAVKVETSDPAIIKAISDAGIAVMPHLGLLPQQRERLGGFKTQGRDAASAQKMIALAKKMEEAGADFMLIEAVPSEVAAIVTKNSSIPVYGIGAGSSVDGQLLVGSDVTGTYLPFKPSFAKKYRDGATLFREAYGEFVAEVQEMKFPEEKHGYKMLDGEAEKLAGGPYQAVMVKHARIGDPIHEGPCKVDADGWCRLSPRDACPPHKFVEDFENSTGGHCRNCPIGTSRCETCRKIPCSCTNVNA